LVLLVVAGACAGSSSAWQGNAPIKIGAIYNLTGSMASLDVPSANGAKLAVKEINDAGGILGRNLELVMYDGQTDAATIGIAATQLVKADKVTAMLGFSDSDMTLAAAPIAAKAGIPFVTSGATSPRLSEAVPTYLYQTCFGDNVQAAAAAEFAYNDLNGRTAYLLIDRDMEYSLLLGTYFRERFTELGGRIVLEDNYRLGDNDFAAQVAALEELGVPPDFLFIAAGPNEVGGLVKQFRDAGIIRPIVGGDGFDTPLLVQLAGSGAENIYFTTHSLMDPQLGSDAAKQFIAAYQAEYMTTPENAFAALGYDTVMLIADSIERAGSDDSQAILEALSKTKDLPAVTGSITCQPGIRIPRKEVTVISVKDGQFSLAKTLVPEKVPAP
jgi:branched-chain amino acid transport system substrate-binding protein